MQASVGRHLLQLEDAEVLEQAGARVRAAQLRRVHPRAAVQALCADGQLL
jgi:hypothetical protein